LVLLAAILLVLGLTAGPARSHDFRGAETWSDPAGALTVSAATEPTRPADSAARLDRLPDAPSVERLGAGAADGLGVLVAALGLAGLGRSWRRGRRTAVATATAALVLGFVVETTPHLVHHSLDRDQGAGCESLQTAERSQVASGTIDPQPVVLSAALPDAPLSAAPAARLVPAPRGRAPPA
jgi:hypothetical protein